jgi:hypothetical protein
LIAIFFATADESANSPKRSATSAPFLQKILPMVFHEQIDAKSRVASHETRQARNYLTDGNTGGDSDAQDTVQFRRTACHLLCFLETVQKGLDSSQVVNAGNEFKLVASG